MKTTCALMAIAAAAGVAMADVEVFFGDTTGGPTYNRVLAGDPPTGLSAVGTNVSYQVVPVFVDVGDSVTFEITETGGTFDPFMTLYVNAFDPMSALSNVVIADDDGGSGSYSMFTTNLTGGVQYFAVVSGFGNADFGTYTLQISAATADVTIGLVPAPSAMALLGVTGLAARRRR